MRKRFLVIVGMCIAGGAAAQDEGKALLEKACTKCHGLAGTMRQRNTRERWSTIVDDMVSRGAEGSDAELEKIVDYLAKTLGPKLAVNRATEEELAAGLGVSRETAAAIAEYRRRNGNFKAIDDLKKVPSIDSALLDKKKDALDFSEQK